jgi:hypothetical protein
MRLYAFTNMYMEGIHAGIQTAHALGELYNKYGMYPKEPEFAKLEDWSKNHKTIYIYNGGLSSMLWDRYQALREFTLQFGLPIARFYESKEALNGALTAVALVVPEEYYRYHLLQKSPQMTAVTNGLGQLLHAPKTDEEKFYDLLHNCERAR